jgi:hypothetical protein
VIFSDRASSHVPRAKQRACARRHAALNASHDVRLGDPGDDPQTLLGLLQVLQRESVSDFAFAVIVISTINYIGILRYVNLIFGARAAAFGVG